MLRAVLIDDEILALDLLEAMLNEIGGIKIIGRFLNPNEGLEQVGMLQPDVLFLDIEMPEMPGIKVAEKMNGFINSTDIVFVTAYEQYALKAFEVQAVDYILKPIEKGRLAKAVERIQQRSNQEHLILDDKNSLSARFLGSFQLSSESNGPIKWRTKKVKELCAYLIHSNGSIHRDKILEDLWPMHTLDKAASLLHTTVYQLRKKLKEIGIEDPIQYKEEKYSVTIDIHTDVKELFLFIQSNQIEKVLDSYNQDYLSDEDYHWSSQHREKIRRSVIHYLETYILKVSTGKQEIFRKVLEKLSELDPWEERYTMDLVQYYINQGNYKEARDIYNRYKKTLQNELGLKPRKEFEEILK